ncbi:STAS domain-containing protein [Streptomyces actinomycinicus]|uniref:STAS domain-containing protein n=1 Tax=Streptomyces actinomycinicus TaxID=1695166 RepID=A0A937EDT3_9ACTN|nr:STAS domain-containing protein [Streptomyces actinomycinicus]MBL1080886.1 STAS domain-containing protein [Streptomyces actinomycinicus]
MSGPEPARPARAGAVPTPAVPTPAVPTPAVPTPAVPRLDVYPLTGRTGLRAAGEVSLPTHGIWERALERAVHEGEDVYYLELSELTFVDVAGAGALADAARRFGGRRLVLDRPPASLPRMLDLLWPGLPKVEVSA